ncbi:MAG: hypothetical protein ACJ746_19670 [Bryobacteraceae bacterium]
MTVLKVEKVGGLLGIMLPDQITARLQINEGDWLSALETEQGYLLTKCHRSTEDKLNTAMSIMNRYSEALKKLAK